MNLFRYGDLVCFQSTNTLTRWFHGKIVSGLKMRRYFMVDDGTGKPPRPVSENRLQRDSGRHGPRWTERPPSAA